MSETFFFPSGTRMIFYALRKYGFIPQSSCCSQLIAFLDKVTEITDYDSWVDAVYLDLSKAFNSVPHLRLLAKLWSMGERGNFLGWLGSFIKGRIEIVSVSGEHSLPYSMISGVPQGSVLGPLLFVAFLNDMDDAIEHSSLLKYADDIKVFIEIKHDHVLQCQSFLQSDLNGLQRWLETWGLCLSPEKCKILHFGRTNPSLTYSIGGNVIESFNAEKDLGIYITSDLKF